MMAPSPDDVHRLDIEAGTRAADSAGLTITLLEIRETVTPLLPENTRLVGRAYEFKPSGTVFDKSVHLTLGYDVNDLPDDVLSVGLAYYDGSLGWVYLEPEPGSVAELGKVSAPVNHFSVFAVLAEVTSETAPGPPGAPTPGPQPEPAPEPTLFSLSNLAILLSESRYFENFTYIARTGEQAIVSAEVSNNGGQSGTYTAVLMLNGTEWERKEISLGPGQTERVSFIVMDNAPGTYTVVIGNLAGEFSSRLWINWWLFTGTVAILVLVAWLTWYIIKRSKKQKAPA
jgi:hypothetical protein